MYSYDLPKTPQTLPCDDEDCFFVSFEDGSVENDSVGVEIGRSAIADICRNSSDREAPTSSSFLGSSRQTDKERYIDDVRKELYFEEPASETSAKKDLAGNKKSTRSSRMLQIHQSMKNKRRQYRSRLLSRSKISSIIKAAVQSPTKAPASADKSSPHANQSNGFKDNRRYHFLEDDEEPLIPDDYDDDRSSAHSLPARLATSMPWKKKSYTDSSSLASAPLVSKASKLKWNRIIQMDSLASFKAPDSSASPMRVSAAKAANNSKTIKTVELSSSSSTVSSAASFASSLTSGRSFDIADGKRFTTQSPRLTSMLQQGLYNLRVDEEDDEDSDTEDDDHPAAGSFAYAIGRRKP